MYDAVGPASPYEPDGSADPEATADEAAAEEKLDETSVELEVSSEGVVSEPVWPKPCPTGPV